MGIQTDRRGICFHEQSLRLGFTRETFILEERVLCTIEGQRLLARRVSPDTQSQARVLTYCRTNGTTFGETHRQDGALHMDVRNCIIIKLRRRICCCIADSRINARF